MKVEAIKISWYQKIWNYLVHAFNFLSNLFEDYNITNKAFCLLIPIFKEKGFDNLKNQVVKYSNNNEQAYKILDSVNSYFNDGIDDVCQNKTFFKKNPCDFISLYLNKGIDKLEKELQSTFNNNIPTSIVNELQKYFNDGFEDICDGYNIVITDFLGKSSESLEENKSKAEL